MLHLRQGLVAGFQADPFHHLVGTNAHLGRFNRFEFGILAPAITENYSSFGELGAIEFSSPAQRNGIWYSDSGSSSIIEFSTMSSLECDSDVSSPPLWKTSPPASPTPRSQAIVNGHQELMEMIRNVPESAYELSLKDIIELTTEKRGSMSEAFQGEKMKKTMKKKKRGDENNSNRRNGTVDSRDFLLKMFVPAVFGPKKRSSSNGTFSKVLPKMEGEKTVDTEWWKKKLSSTRESVNSRTSRCSSTSSTRHMGGLFPGCCSFFHTNRSQK